MRLVPLNAGPSRSPNRVPGREGREHSRAERTLPREAPAPPAGIPGMSPVREASGRPLGRGRGQTWNFSGAFAQIPLRLFSPVKLKPTSVRRKSPASSRGRLCRSKGSQSPLYKHPNAWTPFPARKIPSLCLREESLPRPETHRASPGRCFQLDCRHLVAGLGGHTGASARPSCLRLFKVPEVPFLLSPNQLGIEEFKSCSLGTGVEL